MSTSAAVGDMLASIAPPKLTHGPLCFGAGGRGHFYISKKSEIELRASTRTVEEYHLSRNLEPGETVRAALGGEGRPVLARVNLPDEISRGIERGEVVELCELHMDDSKTAVLPRRTRLNSRDCANVAGPFCSPRTAACAWTTCRPGPIAAN